MITFLVILLLVAAVIGFFTAGVLCVIIGISSLWGYNRHCKKLCQELHAAYQFPWPDDATTCQRAIDLFLYNAQKSIAEPSEVYGNNIIRRHFIGLRVKTSSILKDKSKYFSYFIVYNR